MRGTLVITWLLLPLSLRSESTDINTKTVLNLSTAPATSTIAIVTKSTKPQVSPTLALDSSTVTSRTPTTEATSASSPTTATKTVATTQKPAPTPLTFFTVGEKSTTPAKSLLIPSSTSGDAGTQTTVSTTMAVTSTKTTSQTSRHSADSSQELITTTAAKHSSETPSEVTKNNDVQDLTTITDAPIDAPTATPSATPIAKDTQTPPITTKEYRHTGKAPETVTKTELTLTATTNPNQIPEWTLTTSQSSTVKDSNFTFKYSLSESPSNKDPIQNNMATLCKSFMTDHSQVSCTLVLHNNEPDFNSLTIKIDPKLVKEQYSKIIAKQETALKQTDNKTLIAILASCGALLIMIIILGVCVSHRRKPYNENQQHLTEELHTVENGYHDNPTLEVMEVQPEMQEKKMALNGEFGDSWIVPIDNLMKEDIPDEEDTHL